MNVMEGLSFERSDGSWLKIEVEILDADFEKAVKGWGADPSKVSLNDQYALSALLAEMFVFERQKQARAHDEAWRTTEMPSIHKDIMGRLAALAAKIRGAQG